MIWYSATYIIYMSQTRDQQLFTISEVAADWHELMVPQRIMWPSIVRANGRIRLRCNESDYSREQFQTIGPTVQLADTPSPQSAALGLHPVAVATTY